MGTTELGTVLTHAELSDLKIQGLQESKGLEIPCTPLMIHRIEAGWTWELERSVLGGSVSVLC